MYYVLLVCIRFCWYVLGFAGIYGSNYSDKVGVWGSNYTDLVGVWGSNYVRDKQIWLDPIFSSSLN